MPDSNEAVVKSKKPSSGPLTGLETGWQPSVSTRPEGAAPRLARGDVSQCSLVAASRIHTLNRMFDRLGVYAPGVGTKLPV